MDSRLELGMSVYFPFNVYANRVRAVTACHALIDLRFRSETG